MKIAIVGAGVVGVTTAYELGADGHEVTVFERHAGAAEEASFAQAGVIAPGDMAPWVAPGLVGNLLRQWLYPQHGTHLGWSLTRRELAWLAAARRSARPDLRHLNQARLMRLACYSRQRLHELSEGLGLDYDRSPGLLVLLRGDRERRRVAATLPVLEQAGLRYQELGPDEARAVEPALDPGRRLAGALYLPDDGVANGRQFVQLLRRQAQAHGVRFAFGCPVLPLQPPTPGTLSWQEPDGSPQRGSFDAVVVCAGTASADLLRPLGLDLPLVAVHGHAITAAIGEPMNAPRSGLVDERYRITITRLGERVRVAGGMELGAPADRKNPAMIRTLYQVLQDWFPGAARLSGKCVTVQEWKAARPMLPDGPPVLGASGVPGVWLNIGHGAHGWALACGSARALADLVAGREPEVDLEGLGISRLAG